MRATENQRLETIWCKRAEPETNDRTTRIAPEMGRVDADGVQYRDDVVCNLISGKGGRLVRLVAIAETTWVEQDELIVVASA